MLISGCLLVLTVKCHAEQQTKNSIDIMGARDVFAIKRTSHVVVPTKTMNHIFENLYHNPQQSLEDDQVHAWKHYKEKIRSLAAVHLTDSIQLGLDRIKSGPSKAIKGDIVDINTHLSAKPNSGTSTARGYGLQLRVKLD